MADRVAQMVVKMYFEPVVEPYFHQDSYGYRTREISDSSGRSHAEAMLEV